MDFLFNVENIFNIRLIIIIVFIILFILLGIGLSSLYSKKKTVAIIICRLLWMIPLFVCLFPKSKILKIKTDLIKNDISILIDDSDSMQQYKSNYTQLLSKLSEQAESLGSKLDIHYLSEYSSLVKRGYTPLKEGIRSWLSTINSSWILITDGGDSSSYIGDWNGKVFSGVDEKIKQYKGIILGYDDSYKNKWIDKIEASSVAFEDKTISLYLDIKRNFREKEIIQIQVLIDNKVVLSENLDFINNKDSLEVELKIPPLKRGSYLVEVRLIPSYQEGSVWDNIGFVNVEVLPNTIGVLHIQGSPNWDGRFIRRYLKSEPKFDLISFFILRDIMDNLNISERESSLIPFPVDRLFTEEISHFKVMVLQNFALYKFLRDFEYQKNIVNFVKDGGGLLFIGGVNALTKMDISNKYLSEILPFRSRSLSNKDDLGSNFMDYLFYEDNSSIDRKGPYFDKNLEFNIEFSDIDKSKRSLLDVYDEWKLMKEELESIDFKGLHHTENISIKDDVSTLLNARIKGSSGSGSGSGKSIPLVMASYPMKGRALWVFSDNLWELAFKGKSRNSYNNFLSSAFRWIANQDIKPYLNIEDFKLEQEGVYLRWNLSLNGGAAKYIELNKDWNIWVCDKKMEYLNNKKELINLEKISDDSVIINGSLYIKDSSKSSNKDITKMKECTISIEGKNASLGGLKLSRKGIIPEIKKDSEIKEGSLYVLNKLATVLNAELKIKNKDDKDSKWNDIDYDIIQSIEQSSTNPLFRSMVVKDYFWGFKTVFFYITILFMIIEVCIRKNII